MFNPIEPTDLLSRLTQEMHTFSGCARLLVTLCTSAVLTAVLLNFLLARQAHTVRTKKKSTVETGSMLAFFAGFYLLIRFRVGVHEIPGLYYPAAIFGLLLLVLGTVFNILGRFALGRNWGNHVVIYEDHQLIIGGAYRFVRHPLYAALIWMFSGAALVFQNWAALLATLFIFLPGMFYRGKQEEKALTAQFANYESYRNHTGMFFPIAMGPEIARVPREAFAFCRFSLTAMLWLALYFRNPWLVVAVFGILVLSVILKVQRSPMIQLYQQTILRVFPTLQYELLDVPAMRFAHGLGALMSLGVVLSLLIAPTGGWYCLLALCILKTIAALGYCPASKLFVCMRNGGCCALTR
jgi:protein-S-isoprenylcysteine O-methyltransferase Ste14